MARRTNAYVDTSALIAFVDRSDTHHARFRGLFANPPALFTTALVIAEGQGWFLKRYDTTRALQFIALIESLEPLRQVVIDTAELAGGYRILRRFPDQELTLADAVGLHVMREERATVCWSTDRHLRLTGVPLAIDQG